MLIICAVACAYIALFLPVNVRCSGDENMLLCAGSDEYAQFPHLMSMMTRDRTTMGSVSRLLDHHHYYYGYPFYFVSALVVLPVKILAVFRDGNYTRTYMLLLRQMSPVFIAASIVLLVAIWTKFKSLASSVSMFVFLSFLPAVFTNNTWWHPDAMATFLVVFALFGLDRDRLRFGKWFWISAIACGLATSTKTIGVFFGGAIPLYLLIGVHRGRLTFPKALQAGVVFAIVMFLTILISYPILVVKFTEIIETLRNQSAINNQGWGIRTEKGPIAHYRDILRAGFGLWPLYILPVIAAILCVKTGQRRLPVVMTLAWVLPFAAYLLFIVARKSEYYYLPIMLPFLAMIWAPPLWNGNNLNRFSLLMLMALALFGQISIYLFRDYKIYSDLAKQERTSPNIAFYRTLFSSNVLSSLSGTQLKIFRDPYVYLPPNSLYDVRMKWGIADYDDVNYLPDLIILQQDNIRNITDPEHIRLSLNQEQARRSLVFYNDAKNNRLKGYTRIEETAFAVAFRKMAKD